MWHPFLLSLMVGCGVEALLCGVGLVSILTGGVGPCGPTGTFPWWLVLVHRPGIWFSNIVPEEHWFLRFTIMIVTTTTVLSVIASVVISMRTGFALKRRER